MTLAAIDQIEAGSRAAARGGAPNGATGATSGAALALAGAKFARENVALYIESVYDAHFELAQIDKKLHRGYHNLGGGATFGGSLTPAEVSSLADAYSEATARLYPHFGMRLGS